MSKGHRERKVARSRKKQEVRQERALLIARRQAAKKLAKLEEARA